MSVCEFSMARSLIGRKSFCDDCGDGVLASFGAWLPLCPGLLTKESRVFSSSNFWKNKCYERNLQTKKLVIPAQMPVVDGAVSRLIFLRPPRLHLPSNRYHERWKWKRIKFLTLISKYEKNLRFVVIRVFILLKYKSFRKTAFERIVGFAIITVSVSVIAITITITLAVVIPMMTIVSSRAKKTKAVKTLWILLIHLCPTLLLKWRSKNVLPRIIAAVRWCFGRLPPRWRWLRSLLWSIPVVTSGWWAAASAKTRKKLDTIT